MNPQPELEPLEPDLLRQILEHKIKQWRVDLEHARLDTKVAKVIENKELEARAVKMATDAIKAIECLQAELALLPEPAIKEVAHGRTE